MRQAEFIHDAREIRHDLGRRHFAVAFDRLGEDFRILAPLPGGDATGVDGLHAVRFRRPDKPGDDVFGPFGVASFQQVQQDLVVGHQRETRLIDDRRIAEFFVGVLRTKNGDGRFHDRRVAHARIQVAGGKRGGRGSAQACAALRGCGGTGRLPAGSPGSVHGRNSTPRRRHGCECPLRPGRPPCRRHQWCVPPSTSRDNATVGDADILHDAIDAIGGIVNFSARYPQHGSRILPVTFSARSQRQSEHGHLRLVATRAFLQRLPGCDGSRLHRLDRAIEVPAARAGESHPSGRRYPVR